MSEEYHEINVKGFVNLRKFERCPECMSTRLVRDYELAEVVCTNCGYVIDERIADRGPEWRGFNEEQRKRRARIGAPTTHVIHDKGLSTVIDSCDHDSLGKRLSSWRKAEADRLRRWQRRTRMLDSAERNLAYLLSEASKIADALNLPKAVVEAVAVICHKAVKECPIKGRSIRGMAAAAVYLACRQLNIPRAFEEVIQASGSTKREVGKGYRFLVEELKYPSPQPKLTQYVRKLSNQLMMKKKVEELAQTILKLANELKLTSGRAPVGIVAAASYVASVLTGERRTQREIAETAQVTEVTIRNRYRELLDHLWLIVSV